MALVRRSNAALGRLAAELLFKVGCEENIPVDVEEIAEFDLNLTIEPKIGFNVGKGVEGAISHDLATIYVDADLMKNTKWLRTTIAHEIAHLILHAEFIRTLAFADDDGWKSATLEISNADNDVLEAEAQVFADALLVPDAGLIKLHAEAAVELAEEGRLFENLSQGSKRQIAGRIAKRFEVSTRIVERRLASLGLGGWEPQIDESRILPGMVHLD